MEKQLKDLPDYHDIGHLRSALLHVPERNVALDIGAHRGIWTRLLAQHFELVVAFEPVQELYDQIPDWAQIEKWQVALGCFRHRCSIEPGEENTGQGHVVPGDTIDVFPLDGYWQFPTIDFMKIDVEGYECAVLDGAASSIQEHKPTIMLEKNGLGLRHYGIPDSDIDEKMDRLGYYLVTKWNKDFLYKPRESEDDFASGELLGAKL